MSTMTKVFVVLTAVLAITVSVLFVAAAAQWSNWKSLAQTYQTSAHGEFVQRMNMQATMEARLAMMEDTLQGVQQDLADARQENKDLTDQLAEARSDLARRTNEAVAAEASRKKLEEVLDVQTAELTATQKQNQTLLSQNVDLQTRNSRLNSRVLELSSNVTILQDEQRNLQEKLYAAEQRLADCQQAVATGERIASESPAPAGVVPVTPAVAGPIRGDIVEVADNYASINVGETSGVERGMVFLVYRGADYVAELVVERVRPKDAGGKLRTIAQAVRSGDTVVYGLESAGQ